MELHTAIVGMSTLIALAAIFNHSRNARRQTTANLVIQQRNDASLKQARTLVTVLNQKNEITKLAHDDAKGSDQRNAVLAVLNNYEFIATGLREGAFDLQLYKRMTYSTVVNDWKALKPFIFDLRRQVERETIFQEFQWLAEKFSYQPLKTDHRV